MAKSKVKKLKLDKVSKTKKLDKVSKRKELTSQEILRDKQMITRCKRVK